MWHPVLLHLLGTSHHDFSAPHHVTVVWGLAHALGDWWPYWVLTPICRSSTIPNGWRLHTAHPIAILGSNGGMYPESLDLHAAGSLYQCPSLESLDCYFLCVVHLWV